jgi:multiple sugar transport system permease protein
MAIAKKSLLKPKVPLTPTEKREARTFYILISPWIFGLIFFTGIPLVWSLYLSFTKWDVLTPPQFIGVENYADMLSDKDFYQSLKVTTVYSLVSVPVRLAIALGLALLLNSATRAVGFFRTAFYLPAVVASVAVAVIWRWLFNPRFGPINGFLAVIGIDGPAWLNDPDYALWALIIMSFWGVGGEMLIFFAGLKGIPDQLYEAAEIDGASKWRKFLNITIPMLSPTIFFNLVMSVIGSFQTFDSAFVISTASARDLGSPAGSTLFYVLNIYRQGFSRLNMGYATALAWVLLALLFILTYLINRSSQRWVYTEGAS